MSFRIIYALSFVLALLSTQCNSFKPVTSSSGATHTTTTKGGSYASKRQAVVDKAKEYQGVKYKYAGRSPKTGFDCSGFVYYVYDAFDIDVTPVSRVQETEGQRIKVSEAKAGDLIFFRKSKTGSVFHVALVVDNTAEGLSVVHSTSSRGVIVENITKSSYWKAKVWTARRFING